MMADQQTQRLPEAEAELAAFARFCGFSGLSAFSKALTAHANRVQTHYALLFEEGPSLATEVGSLVFTGTQDDPDTLATLKRLGFREPARVTETVRGWHFGRRPAVTSQRAREVLTELTPALLAALGRTPDPDGALAALDEAFGHMKAATELLTLLVSNDTLRDLFADVLGTAPRLARIVAQGPHVLDAVIDPAFLVPRDNDAAIEERMRLMVGQPVPMEEFLDRIREVTRQESFGLRAALVARPLAAAGGRGLRRHRAGGAAPDLRARRGRVCRRIWPRAGRGGGHSRARPGRGARGDGDLRSRSRRGL